MNDSFESWFDGLWPRPSLPRPKEELFDVVNDPDEFTDLARNPVCQEIKVQLAAQLGRWTRETDDPVLQSPVPPRLNPWPGELV